MAKWFLTNHVQQVFAPFVHIPTVRTTFVQASDSTFILYLHHAQFAEKMLVTITASDLTLAAWLPGCVPDCLLACLPAWQCSCCAFKLPCYWRRLLGRRLFIKFRAPTGELNSAIKLNDWECIQAELKFTKKRKLKWN